MAKSNTNVELKIKTLIDVGYVANIETGEIYTSKNKIAKSYDIYGHQILATKRQNKYFSIRAEYFIWYLKYGTIPFKIYHINGNKSDNRISNLKEVKNKKDEELDNSIEIDITNKNLLKIIKFYLNRIPGFNRIIDKHIKNTITNEAFIKIIRLISDKKISNVYEEIKGYIFILCKNEVYINIKPRKTALKINDNYDDLSVLDLHQNDYYDEDERFFNEVLNHLLEVNFLWYQIIEMKLDNKSIKEMQDELGSPLRNIEYERQKCYKYIRNNVDKFR